MDPNATLAALIDAATDGDAQEVKYFADALVDWIAQGGFAPSDPRTTIPEGCRPKCMECGR